MKLRTVKAQHPAVRDDIADLVTRRPLPGQNVPQIDPFLFLNHHGPQVYPPNNRGLPFGPHPHRGFETVTFIVEGSLSHSDTGGHESVIHAGGVQWMTAGSGLVHAELSPAEFKRTGGPLEILQLWVNLPSTLKMTAPKYVGLQMDQIPSVVTDEGRVKVDVIAGSFGSQKGAIETLWGETMTTIALAPQAQCVLDVPTERNVFLYIVRGEVSISGSRVQAQHLIEFENDGERIEVQASSPAFLVFGHAKPIGEPVVAHGPFVMNTREEIMEAIRDYQAGKFG